MPSKSKVYIAGAGYSQASKGGTSKLALVSAATKALIDAGVTYDDVTKGVISKKLDSGSEAFNAFDQKAITVDEVKDGSELGSCFDLVNDQGEQCVLLIAAEKSNTTAFVIVSEDFLWRHPYLKDSSAVISKSKSAESNGEGLYSVCQILWTLRGWSRPEDAEGTGKKSHHNGFELRRVDDKSVPKWKEVEHKQDGKFRLRYNPATETREISQEDFEAVRASGKKGKNSDHFKRKGGDRAALAKL